MFWSTWLTLCCSNKSRTIPFENRKNIAVVALSPDSNVLITVDEGQARRISPQVFFEASDKPLLDGRALLVNFKRGVVLHHFNFHNPVRAIQFSPDGK